MLRRARVVGPSMALLVGILVAVSGLRGPEPGGTRSPEPRGGPRADGPAEYIEWRNLSLRDETGALSAHGLMIGKAHVDAMRAVPSPPSGAGINRGSWSSIGPGNVGGRVRTIAIHPATPDTMFIGSVGGGIWTTADGGASWAPVNDFMANLAVSAIVFVPGAANTLFAGTGEGFYNSDGLRGAGIFRSTDGGATWTQLPATSTAPAGGQSAADYYYVNELAVSHTGTSLLAATRTGIFRSTDGGASFTRATMVGGSAIVAGNGIVDVDFHPADATRAVAATFAGTALHSSDGGATWTLAAGMPGGGSFVRSELAVAPSNGSIVYAGVDLDVGSLYKSTDGGQTYTEIFDGASDAAVDPYCFQPGCATNFSQGWYDNLLFVSPTDENFLVWGGVDLWRSTTGGTTWSRMSRWQAHATSGPTSAHADHHVAVAHPAFDGTANRIVFFANDGGVYRAGDVSTVGAAFPHQSGWTELNNGLALTQFYGGAGHPASGRITGGTQDNGTLFYHPGISNPSENWTTPFGGDGGFSAYDSADVNYFYGEYVYAYIHRNTSGGASFSSYIYSGIADAGVSNNTEFIAAFIKDPNDNNRLLVPSVRLWRTTNAKAPAPAWEEIKATLGITDKISAIGVAPGNSDIIYAGHNAGRLYKTTMGTAAAATVLGSWTTIDDNAGANPLPNRRITRITVDPGDNQVVYVTFGGFSGDNIYKSTNGGATWTDITGPFGGPTALPDIPVRDLEVHPTNSAWLYAGTELGIFTSENGGASWMLPHDGPSNVSVDELFFLGSTLVAVTHGRGLFSTPTTGGGSAPTAVNDAYATSLNTPINVPAPGVLANDAANGGGSMTALLVTTVGNGTLGLNADGSFVYTPASGFFGTDSFTYRAVNAVGPSSVATVTLTVSAAPPAVQPPTGLYTRAIVGNLVTIQWTPPASGLAPTGYVLEGGVAPGQVLASLPTGGTAPLFTFAAPPGAFFIRVHTLAGASRSIASNEIQIFVEVPAAPSAPANLLGLVDGSSLALAWRSTFAGGAPSALLLDVSGTLAATLPLPPGDSFTFAGVPDGTYTLSLRASNAAGTSGPSNAITLTFPGPCSGVPEAPANFVVSSAGSVITASWDPAASGAAPTGFVLSVTGAFTGAFPTTLRSLSGAVGPGTYSLSVQATNACGTGAATPAQVVTIP